MESTPLRFTSVKYLIDMIYIYRVDHACPYIRILTILNQSQDN